VYIVLSVEGLGGDIDGEASNDYFGRSVSLSSNGSIVAIGGTGNSPDFGAVRVFQYVMGTWSQLGVDIHGEAANDKSGWSISLSSDGSIVAIGAILNDGSAIDSGYVRIYEYITGNPGSWSQLGGDIVGEAQSDRSGWSVSLSNDGRIIAIGADLNTGGTVANAGHVRVYEYVMETWSQLGVNIDGEAANDQSGNSVSLSSDGSVVAIGAISGNVGSGPVRVYKRV
jgi:hypothetical protein